MTRSRRGPARALQAIWAFHNPLWALSEARPANEVYFLDDLLPREDFAATPIYHI